MSIIAYYIPFIVLLLAMVAGSVITKKLTAAGAITGGGIAILVFAGAGYTGTAMLLVFFVLGTIATSWRKEDKRSIKSVADQQSSRNAMQVLANGGVAGVLSILLLLIPAWAELFRTMMAASLASAMADTLSSELGMICGRNFYNIITFKKDSKGLDGVVSLEGTLIGIAGSFIIALIYAWGFGWNDAMIIIVIAGTAGNLADSILGAVFERKKYLNNDLVNFLNTCIAAAVGGCCWLLL